MTIDMGGKVTLVPIELVPSKCLTRDKQLFKGVDIFKGYSEREMAHITIHVCGRNKKPYFVAVPRDHLGCMGAVRFNIASKEDRSPAKKTGR